MIEKIVLGGGCFWCVEAVFLAVKGVTKVVSGYSNGRTERPTYEQVCTGRTGYAEVVEVEFDNQVISLAQVCPTFSVHMIQPPSIDKAMMSVRNTVRLCIGWFKTKRW
jgi:peptide-methionine (S)-S-oxide reductase